METLKGVILVGGPSVGTRFRPLSMDLPKPLFPIAGSPMIYHHVAALAKLPGMKEILLIGFFEQSKFDRFLTEVQMEFIHINIRYLREYQALGTAGGLYHFRDEILRGNPNKIFVMNGDICSSFPLEDMLYFHNSQDLPVATLLGVRVDKSEVQKYGSVVVNPETNEVLHFVEKPETFISDLISCGVYLFEAKAIFNVIRDAMVRKRQQELEFADPDSAGATKDDKIRLEQDVLALLVASQKLYAHVCHPTKDFWMQIKTPTSAIPANRAYLQHFRKTAPRRLSVSTPKNFNLEELAQMVNEPAGPVLIQPVTIHPTAVIHPTAKIGPNVMIGPRALVGRGVRIRDAIVLDNAEIKNDSCILQSIVGWESKIGAWCRVEGAPGDASHLNATYKGLKIPTATILGKDVTVADETVLRNCIVLPHKELKASFHNEIIV